MTDNTILDALKQAKDYILKAGSDSDMAPVIEAIDQALSAADAVEAKPQTVEDDSVPITARIWKRDSTSEWVLELEGVINDTSFTCRHTEPLATPLEDVAGLPSLYAALPAPVEAHPVARVVDENPADEFYSVRDWLIAAWCAGYYDAGYTHDSAYAQEKAGGFADHACSALSSNQVNDQETEFTPGKKREAYLLSLLLSHFKDIGVGNGEPGWIEHSDQNGGLRRDALSFEGEMLFGFEAIQERIKSLASASANDQVNAVQEDSKKPCHHKDTTCIFDGVTCNECGAFHTDSGWGIARTRWFSSRAVAKFYMENGRLPEAAAITAKQADN